MPVNAAPPTTSVEGAATTAMEVEETAALEGTAAATEEATTEVATKAPVDPHATSLPMAVGSTGSGGSSSGNGVIGASAATLFSSGDPNAFAVHISGVARKALECMPFTACAGYAPDVPDPFLENYPLFIHAVRPDLPFVVDVEMQVVRAAKVTSPRLTSPYSPLSALLPSPPLTSPPLNSHLQYTTQPNTCLKVVFGDAQSCANCLRLANNELLENIEARSYAPRRPPQRAVTVGDERTDIMGEEGDERVMRVRPHRFG